MDQRKSLKDETVSQLQLNDRPSDVLEENKLQQNEADEEVGDDENGLLPLLMDKEKQRQKKRRSKRQRIGHDNHSRKATLLRPHLLAAILTVALFSFWLLDSLKDPVLAILVDGHIDYHQPRAKMCSVIGTLCLVMIIEQSGKRKRKRQQKDQQAMRDSSDVLEGGGTWTKMNISTSIDYFGWGHARQEEIEDVERIPISAFYWVGSSYTVAFTVLGCCLKQHPSFALTLNRDHGVTEAISAINEDDGLQVENVMLWRILAYVMYTTIESFGSLSMATFWSFANSTLSLEVAESYYGLIISCAQVGAIGGSTVATLKLTVPTFFGIGSIVIIKQMALVAWYGHLFPSPMTEAPTILASQPLTASLTNSSQPKFSKQESEFVDDSKYMPGFHLVFKHRYVMLILGVSCLYEIGLTCLDYEMKLIGLDRFAPSSDMMEISSSSASSRTRPFNSFSQFMAGYGQLTNVLSLLLSFFAFPYLMQRHGLKWTVRLFPTLLLLVTIMVYGIAPRNLYVLFWGMSLLKAMTYSINDPAKEILYLPTSNAIKFRAKFWIDVVGARVAKAIGSSINTYAGSIDRIVKYGLVPSILTACALWAVCYYVGIEFEHLLDSGKIVGRTLDDDDENIPTDHISPSDDDDGSNDEFLDIDSDEDSDWKSNASIELIRVSEK